MNYVQVRHGRRYDSPDKFNPHPAVQMPSAECLVCYNFQGALKSLKICENIVRVSNSLDPGHPDPICLQMELWPRSAGDASLRV